MIEKRLQYKAWVPSKLAMGCEQLGGTDWGYIDHAQVSKAVNVAIENGITVFDTADVYGLGKSEKELSAALGKHRHDAFIITKFGVRWDDNADGSRARTYKDGSGAYVKIAVENSLRRLDIDVIPLYFIHWPDPSVPLTETLDALEELRSEGKIMNYGLSNFTEKDIVTHAGKYAISAVQGPYNLIDRMRFEPMYAACGDLGITRFSYGALAQGLLSGKYKSDSNFDQADRRHRLQHFLPGEWERNNVILENLKKVALHHQKSMAEVAIRWILDCGMIDCAIVGVKSPEQAINNAAALSWKLTDADVELLNKVSVVS